MRVVPVVIGFICAGLLSQFPEFSQQYLQRLAGAVQVLKVDVDELDADAAALGLSRAALLGQMAGTPAGERRARAAFARIERYDALNAALNDLRGAGPWARLAQAYRFTDFELARGAMADFRPALPLTVESAVLALIGFSLGFGTSRLALGGVHLPEGMGIRKPDLDEVEVAFDGRADRLLGQKMPDLRLPATAGDPVGLSDLKGVTFLFTYPRTGELGIAFPIGWDRIKGVHGTTDMAVALREAIHDMRKHGINHVYGLSTAGTTEQQRTMRRLDLNFPLLSDPREDFGRVMDTPRFTLNGQVFYQRVGLILHGAKIVAVIDEFGDAGGIPDQVMEAWKNIQQPGRQSV
jgi:peroxiredoxin